MVVRHRKRLPRETVAAPSLAVLKARLDGGLSNLVWWKVSLPMAGGLELHDLLGPFQPKPPYDSVTPLCCLLSKCGGPDRGVVPVLPAARACMPAPYGQALLSVIGRKGSCSTQQYKICFPDKAVVPHCKEDPRQVKRSPLECFM